MLKLEDALVSLKEKGISAIVNQIVNADCLEVLKVLPDNSIDAIVTDPPAGIEFMGKEWDSFKSGKIELTRNSAGGKEDKEGAGNAFSRSRVHVGAYKKGDRENFIEFMENVFTEGLRILKPGGHALVWALPRTSHWTATALENAGFEIRDCVYHVFGSGFPKSLDISKAIDKSVGAERKVVGIKRTPSGAEYPRGYEVRDTAVPFERSDGLQTEANTDNAKLWEGWGTALKPAVECWWLIRKPLSEKTIIENVLKWGTGGLNIEVSRIDYKGEVPNIGGRGKHDRGEGYGFKPLNEVANDWEANQVGRFPSHLIHDGSPEVLDEFAKAGVSKSVKHGGDGKPLDTQAQGWGFKRMPGGFNDTGTPSRFFYCAKPSKAERDGGLEGVEERQMDTSRKEGNPGGDNPRNRGVNKRANFHPTVKPQALMKYLINLITPPNGIVMDCFAGSGSTLVAAKTLGFDCIGVELGEEYANLAEQRFQNAVYVPPPKESQQQLNF